MAYIIGADNIKGSDMEIEKINRRLIQDNLIVFSKAKFTVGEMKLLLYVLSCVNEDEENEYYEIMVKDVKKFYGINDPKYYGAIKKYTKSFMKKVVEIEDKASGDWVMFNWFSYVKYINGEGLIRISVDEDVKKFLIDLKRNFTMIDLQNLINFNSGHSIKLYTILKSKLYIGEYIVDLQYLKKILGVEGKYKLWSAFRERVLKKAMEDIQGTDISFTYKGLKEGKKITSVKFTITTKKGRENKIIDKVEVTHKPTEVEQMMIDIGVRSDVANELFIEFGEEVIRSQIDRLASGGLANISNPSGLLITFIRNYNPNATFETIDEVALRMKNKNEEWRESKKQMERERENTETDRERRREERRLETEYSYIKTVKEKIGFSKEYMKQNVDLYKIAGFRKQFDPIIEEKIGSVDTFNEYLMLINGIIDRVVEIED